MQELPDAATQQRPVLRPDGKAPVEIEQGDLADFAADALAAQQPIGAAALAILLPETDAPQRARKPARSRLSRSVASDASAWRLSAVIAAVTVRPTPL